MLLTRTATQRARKTCSGAARTSQTLALPRSSRPPASASGSMRECIHVPPAGRSTPLAAGHGVTGGWNGMRTAATTPRIGFVGLGHMGGNMAARFLAAGYEVYGEARTPNHAQHLMDDGLRWRATPKAVAESADTILTSIPDDDVLATVGSGPDGI